MAAFFGDFFAAFLTGFLAAGFFAAGFLAAGFFAAGFLAAGFFAAGFLAAGFFAAGFIVINQSLIENLDPYGNRSSHDSDINTRRVALHIYSSLYLFT